MQIIKVFDITGEYALKTKDGNALYNAIVNDVKCGNLTILDFTGVKITVSSFFNYSIGQLVLNTSPEQVHQYLKIQNLVSSSISIMQACYDIAVAKYQNKAIHDYNTREGNQNYYTR